MNNIASLFDVMVTERGGYYVVHPLTPAARAWVVGNVETEPTQWVRRNARCRYTGFKVHPRYFSRLLRSMEASGLAVEI